MIDLADIQSLPLAMLAHRCSKESERFANRQPYDPRFCFEIFRRALQEGNTAAWECIYHQYHRLVVSWVRRHPAFAQTGEDADFLANRAFEAMWHAFTHSDPLEPEQRTPNREKFERFPDINRLLQYLQMCVHSAVRESVQPALPYPEIHTEPEHEHLVEAADRERFWALIDTCLRNDKERLVVRSLFLLQLKPGEIYARHPTLFHSVTEIYRLRDNARERLRRCAALREFLD